MIGFRHADARYPFLWDDPAQPAARWHGPGEGPCQYLADTPDGAWAEFLRHEEISDPVDLDGIARSVWAVEVPDRLIAGARSVEQSGDAAGLPREVLAGDETTYAACQEYARLARARGDRELVAPSAALRPGGARGQRTIGDLCEAEDADGVVWILFGSRPDLRAWRVVEGGRPPVRVLGLVRHFD